MKLPCSILRPADYGDSTAGGISSKVNSIYCVFAKRRTDSYDASSIPFTELNLRDICHDNKDCLIIIGDICCKKLRLRAIPANLILENKNVMFGGNFVHTSDSRFFENPIKIHDRII